MKVRSGVEGMTHFQPMVVRWGEGKVWGLGHDSFPANGGEVGVKVRSGV